MFFYGFLQIFMSIYENKVNINFVISGREMLVLSETEKTQFLIDTGGVSFGSGNNGKTVLVPYLKKNGVKKLIMCLFLILMMIIVKKFEFLSRNKIKI